MTDKECREALLPCPFCGEKPHTDYGHEGYWIGCNNDTCAMGGYWWDDKAVGVERWNTRHDMRVDESVLSEDELRNILNAHYVYNKASGSRFFNVDGAAKDITPYLRTPPSKERARLDMSADIKFALLAAIKERLVMPDHVIAEIVEKAVTKAMMTTPQQERASGEPSAADIERVANAIAENWDKNPIIKAKAAIAAMQREYL